MKNTLLFLNGLSGSGKGWFWENILKPSGAFYKLVSTTTRAPRSGETDGSEYYFRDEAFFDKNKFATKLFVNEDQWSPGKPRWLYGVPESEVFNNIGKNLVYDVIQPRYDRQMMDWFLANGLDAKYDFKVAYFLSHENNFQIAEGRANMPDDLEMRRKNTCDPADFMRADVPVDWFVKSSAKESVFSPRMIKFLEDLAARANR